MDYRVVYVGAQCVFGILFIVLFFLQRQNRLSQEINKLDILYFLFLITVILDALWILIDGRVEYRSLHIALQVVYLSTMALTGYTWLQYSLDFFPAQSLKIQKYKKYFIIPVAITIIMIFLSIKTMWVFVVDESGLYIRGGGHIFTIILNYSYMLLGSYVALKCRRQAQLTMDKRRYLAAALFPIPIFFLSGIQLLLPPGLPAMQGGVLISLLLLYGATQNVLITRDYLTELPNRIAFEKVLMDHMHRYRVEDNKHLYIMEGDLNRFKEINDTYGHPTGDEALQLTASALSNTFAPYGSIIFRTGGDEFMVIAETEEKLSIETISQILNDKLKELSASKKYDLSMSLGILEYEGKEDFNTLMNEVDKELYTIKKQSS